MSPKEFKDYCAKIRDTAVWGGEPEIMALAKAYKVPIHVRRSTFRLPTNPKSPVIMIGPGTVSTRLL